MATNVQPPGAVTGYQHPKCYARSDSNCSTKISREHFISETLLRQIQLNNRAKVAGLKWQEPERFRTILLSSMVSRVLCERHNHALSPLDEVMGRFSETIGEFDRTLGPSALNLASECRSFSGSDIERWMVKCVMGLSASGNLRHSGLKAECVDLLYGRMEWPENWGLYFQSTAGQPIYHSGSFLIETRIDPAKGLILAVEFVIRGLPFLLCLGKPSNPELLGVWRPAAITFKSSTCEKTLSLSWDGDKHGAPVGLKRIGVYEGPPPNWKEWEKNG